MSSDRRTLKHGGEGMPGDSGSSNKDCNNSDNKDVGGKRSSDSKTGDEKPAIPPPPPVLQRVATADEVLKQCIAARTDLGVLTASKMRRDRREIGDGCDANSGTAGGAVKSRHS